MSNFYTTTVDSYTLSGNPLTTGDINADTGSYFQGVGQSFTGNGSKLSSAIFYIKRPLANGQLVSKLYAHTGTFGTSSKPTGDPLAVSTPVDISTVSATSFNPVTFNFGDGYSLVNGTKYVITVIYTGTDESNYTMVGANSTKTGHDGNYSYLVDTTWTAYGLGGDVHFVVFGVIEDRDVSTGGGNITDQKNRNIWRPSNQAVKWSEKEAARQINRIRPQNTVRYRAAIPHTKAVMHKRIRNPHA